MSPPKINSADPLKYRLVGQSQSDLDDSEGDVGRLKKTHAGCSGHISANRTLGPQVVAESAFDIEGVGVGQSSQERIAGHRTHDTLGAVVLAVTKRGEDFLVVVESQAAGEPDPQRVAEVIAEGLFDQDRRLAVDRPGSLVDRVAGQTTIPYPPESVTDRTPSTPCACAVAIGAEITRRVAASSRFNVTRTPLAGPAVD